MERVEKTRMALAALFHEQVALQEPAASEEAAVPALPRQPGIMIVDAVRYGTHLDVLCHPDQVVAVAQILDGEGFFLEAISGVDWIEKQQLEVLYDYNCLGGAQCRVLVHTIVDRSAPVVPTVSGIFPAADWHERETFDFYGVRFAGHPNLIRILLPEDADFHPLLKDFMP